MNSQTTQPDSGDPTANWGLTEWKTVIHNLAQVPEGDPRYAQAQQYKAQALDAINGLMQTSNTSDRLAAGQLAPGVAGDILAGVVGFGRGASLGLAKPPNVPGVGDVIQEAHPKATAAGDIAGTVATSMLATPLTAGLSPWLAGAVIGGGTGAVRGALDPMLTGDRKIDALLGGLGGVIVGPIVGKATSVTNKAITTVGRNIARIFATKVGSNAVDATEAVLRQFLATKGVAQAEIDATIARSRPLWEQSVPRPALATNTSAAPLAAPSVSRTLQDLSIPRGAAVQAAKATENVAPIAGTEGRGFSVSGARATPVVPETQPTLAEMTGMANLQVPKNAGQVLRSAADNLGRPLSEDERDLVLQRVLKQSSVPRINREELGYQPRQVWNWAEAHGMDPNDPATREAMKAASRRGSPSWMKDWDPRQGLGLLFGLGLGGAAASSARTQ